MNIKTYLDKAYFELKSNLTYDDIRITVSHYRKKLILSFVIIVSDKRRKTLDNPHKLKYHKWQPNIAYRITDEELIKISELVVKLCPAKMKIFRKKKDIKNCQVVYFLYPDFSKF